MKRLLTSLFVIATALMTWAQKTPQVIWTEGNTTLTFLNDETVYAPGDSYNGQEVTTVWQGDAVTNITNPGWPNNRVTTVVFDSSFSSVRPILTYRWFSSCSSLTSLVGMENLNTSEVKNMDGMFMNCSKLTAIDLSHFQTSKVTNMASMFSGCSALVELDLSSFQTPNVTSLRGMFYNCSALKTLNLSSFDTSNVTDMSTTFGWCQSLESLDLSNFNTSKVTTFSQTFQSCSNMTTLKLSTDFDTPSATALNSMFSSCLKLRSLDISHFNTSKVTKMNNMFNACMALQHVDVSNFDTSNVTDMGAMFSSCNKLDTIDVSNFNTAKVTKMNSMFAHCMNVRNLDVSNFNTSNVTTMSNMFSGCSSVTELDVSNFNTAKVTGMNSMFSTCNKLTSLDVTNFNTSKVTDMSYMFQGCAGLTYLEVRNFDTSKVTNMRSMFASCKLLYYLDLTNFNLSSNSVIVTEMFGGKFDSPTDTTFVYTNATTGARIASTKPKNLIVGDETNGFTCNDCWLYDMREPRIPYPFDADKVTYVRTIAKGGNGNTIMLPCDFDVPQGMKAYELRPAERQVRDNIIYFQEMDQSEPMKANTPYLIANWGTRDVAQMEMKSATHVINTVSYYEYLDHHVISYYPETGGSETISTTLKDGTHVTMSGTFRTMPNSEVADQGIYIFQTGNKWKQVKSSNTSAYIRPYRAYLVKEGSGTSSGVKYESIFVDKDESTAIAKVTTNGNKGNGQTYDLSGRRMTSPRRGTYIIDGKKIATWQ